MVNAGIIFSGVTSFRSVMVIMFLLYANYAPSSYYPTGFASLWFSQPLAPEIPLFTVSEDEFLSTICTDKLLFRKYCIHYAPTLSISLLARFFSLPAWFPLLKYFWDIFGEEFIYANN